MRGGGQRLLGGLGRVDLVAGPAQARLQRAQDLLLVVDDEDARPTHVAYLGLDRGQREHERRTLPRSRLGPDAAVVRLGESARDREAEPRPLPAAVRAPLERLEDPLEIARSDTPSPRSTTRIENLGRSGRHVHAHRCPTST